MINKSWTYISESTAMSFIPRQYTETTGMNMSVENIWGVGAQLA